VLDEALLEELPPLDVPVEDVAALVVDPTVAFATLIVAVELNLMTYVPVGDVT
jgi:hypothetical protein